MIDGREARFRWLLERTFSLLCVLVFAACVLAGCRTPLSIYPVYEREDLFVDDSILGNWILCQDTDQPLVITVEKCKSDPKAYDLEWQDNDKVSRTELRLTRIGRYTFADLEPPPLSEWSPPKVPSPMMQMHLFARLARKHKALLAMAPEVDGVENFTKKAENETGIKLVPIPHRGESRVDSVIVSTTQELRRFLVEHPNYPKLFSPFPFGRDRNACEIEARELQSAETPDDAEIAYKLALAYMRRGRFNDASAAWKRAPAHQQPNGLNPLAHAFMIAGKENEALALMKSGVRTTGEATLECSVGWAYLEAGRSRDALASFARCPGPDSVRSAIAYEQIGDFARARAEFNKQSRTDSYSTVYAAAGEFAQNNFAAAAEQFERALYPSSHWRYFLMLHQGKKDEARRRLDSDFRVSVAAPHQFPGQPPDLGRLVRRYLRHELDEKAFISAINPVQDTQLCIAYFVIGEKHLLDGDRAGARDSFQKAVNTRAAVSPEWIVSNARLKQLAAK